MPWYSYTGAMLAANVMRPGKHGVSQEALTSYATHGVFAYLMFMYLRYFESNMAVVEYLTSFAATAFFWFGLSYSFGLFQINRKRDGMDWEPLTRAWERGPHLTPVQRSLREILSIFAGFATQWRDMEIKYILMFCVGFVVVGFGFYLIESQKEVLWVQELMKRDAAGMNKTIIPGDESLPLPQDIGEEPEEEEEKKDEKKDEAKDATAKKDE